MSKRGGLGRGLSALIPGAPEGVDAGSRVHGGAGQRDRAEPEATADPLRRRGARGSGGVDPRGRDPAAPGRAAGGRRSLRGDRGGAAPAGREGGGARHRSRRVARLRRRGAPPRRPDREHPPGGPQPDRAGRGVQGAPRRARAQAGGARGQGRCVAVTHREHDPPAGVSRWTCSSCSPTTRSPRAMRGRSCPSATRRRCRRSRCASRRRTCRCGRPRRRSVDSSRRRPTQGSQRTGARSRPRAMPRSPRSRRSCPSSWRRGCRSRWAPSAGRS